MTPFFMYNVSDQTQQNTKGKSLLMDNIILYLLTIIQEQHQQICWLILFICRYIPLKQWAHDELHSPKYQKFLTDKLPIIKPFITAYVMAKPSNQSKPKKVKHAPFLKIPYVLSVVHHMSTSTIIQAAAVSSNARSVARPLSTARK